MDPLIAVNRLFKEYSEDLPEPVKVLQNLNVFVVGFGCFWKLSEIILTPLGPPGASLGSW